MYEDPAGAGAYLTVCPEGTCSTQPQEAAAHPSFSHHSYPRYPPSFCVSQQLEAGRLKELGRT
jgi:hypothetical protein